jgi:nucleoside-diphosphate-sugar epimerase
MTTHAIIGYGQIGRPLADHLIEAGDTVRILTRGGTSLSHPNVENLSVDICDQTAATAALAGADVVYNCANPPYTKWPELFPQIQRSAMAATAATNAVYVACSNLYMYAPSTSALTEDSTYGSPARKGRVRAEMTTELLTAHRAGTIRATSVHGADYFGPGITDSLIGKQFVPKILAGKAAQVLSDPDIPHAFTYDIDMVRALVAAGSDPRAWGRTWHAPIAATLTLRQFAQRIGAEAGVTGKVSQVPPLLFSLLAKIIPLMRELKEMSYETDQPFLVNDKAIGEILGVHATPIGMAITATVSSWKALAPAH